MIRKIVSTITGVWTEVSEANEDRRLRESVLTTGEKRQLRDWCQSLSLSVGPIGPVSTAFAGPCPVDMKDVERRVSEKKQALTLGAE